MWQQYPMNGVVNWPCDEKIVGVLGVAPIATIDFFQKLSSRPVEKDWQHLRVIIDSNPKIPSRGRYLELHEADPTPFIQQSIRNLAKQGAALVAIPCNTAHVLYKKYAFATDVNIHIPNMIEITAKGAAHVLRSQRRKRVLVLASTQVIQHKLYEHALERYGLDIEPCQEQKTVSQFIEGVKQGKDIISLKESIITLIKKYNNIDCVILGCTELSVLLSPNDLAIPIIDSNQELADYCYGFCSGTVNTK